MPSPDRKPEPDSRRETACLVEIRRSVLRQAQTFPPGGERNQHRQIALSLRGLFTNKASLESHTLDG
jgi:hypothetical protein